MPDEYIFRFPGTKELFLEKLKHFQNSERENGFPEAVLIELSENDIRIGIERTGHCSGNWFVSKFVEADDEIEFRGNIENIGTSPCQDTRSTRQKAFDRFTSILLTIFFLPIFILILPFVAFSILREILREHIANKKGHTQPRHKNAEEKLTNLMENRLGCHRVIPPTD